jgi:hypothetical protein
MEMKKAGGCGGSPCHQGQRGGNGHSQRLGEDKEKDRRYPCRPIAANSASINKAVIPAASVCWLSIKKKGGVCRRPVSFGAIANYILSIFSPLSIFTLMT